jgi:hypothetical protein
MEMPGGEWFLRWGAKDSEVFLADVNVGGELKMSNLL